MGDESGSDRRASDSKEATKAGERSPLALAGLGVQFSAALLLFVYAGSWLDERLGVSPLFLLLGLFIGGGGSFYLSYRRLMAPRNGK